MTSRRSRRRPRRWYRSRSFARGSTSRLRSVGIDRRGSGGDGSADDASDDEVVDAEIVDEPGA